MEFVYLSIILVFVVVMYGVGRFTPSIPGQREFIDKLPLAVRVILLVICGGLMYFLLTGLLL